MAACCSHCVDADGFFGEGIAGRELRRYRRKGPPRSTRLLLRALRRHDLKDRTLLDVGGGVGAIQHDLIPEGLKQVTQVDASTAYLAASRKEAEQRGNGDRASFLFGDFVEIADSVDEADFVTLDRVICCYPDMERLVSAALDKANHVCGLVYPRERRLTRWGIALGNAYLRLRRSSFRVFVHSHAELDALMKTRGFVRCHAATTPLWEVALYERNGPDRN